MQKSLFRQEAMDNVEKGQVIARVRQGGGAETDVVSLFDGRVDSVLVKEGDEPLTAYVFVAGEERPAKLVLPSSAG